jgi:endonuclease III
MFPLPEVVRLLAEHYGPPERPPTADPFELILLENVAYLASPARRREAFEILKATVGTSPRSLLKARPQTLEKATARGILKAASAAKLRECARIASEDFGGDLGAAVQGPVEAAKRALRRFPGIGEPGAEKILLFAGRQALLAPESNGLRVLVRLGLAREGTSYAKTYAGARCLVDGLPAEAMALQEAHLLLQHHGRTLCKRSAPLCEACPLRSGCAYARRERA